MNEKRKGKTAIKWCVGKKSSKLGYLRGFDQPIPYKMDLFDVTKGVWIKVMVN